MIKQECIGIPDMILLLMIFCFKKIKIKAEIVLSPGGAYFKILISYFGIDLDEIRIFLLSLILFLILTSWVSFTQINRKRKK